MVQIAHKLVGAAMSTSHVAWVAHRPQTKHPVAGPTSAHVDARGVRCHVFGSSGGFQESRGRDAFPFNETEYRRVYPQVLHQTLGDTQAPLLAQGVLLLFDEPINLQAQVNAAKQVLVLAIAGDTCNALLQQAQSESLSRPLTINLLASMVEQYQGQDPNRWSLLKFAVVRIEEGIYYGRLFFGNPATGRVMYDCDCRPSDGVWLAQRFHAPMYVHQQVWQTYSCALNDMIGSAGASGTTGSREPAPKPPPPVGAQKAAKGETRSMYLTTEPHVDNPWHVVEGEYDEVALLKRQMQLAIREEDYSKAADLRDHPLLQTYLKLHTSIQGGKQAQAQVLLQELHRQVEKWRQQEREQSNNRH